MLSQQRRRSEMMLMFIRNGLEQNFPYRKLPRQWTLNVHKGAYFSEP